MNAGGLIIVAGVFLVTAATWRLLRRPKRYSAPPDDMRRADDAFDQPPYDAEEATDRAARSTIRSWWGH